MTRGGNPNSELEQSILRAPGEVQVPESMVAWAQQFQDAMMMYSCAIREVKTKLEVLNDELSVRNQRNPIEMIKSRVKQPRSIVEKLKRKGYPLTLQAMQDNLDDIAGVRVICSFVDDIYAIAGMMMRQDDVRVLQIKDYIKNPKDNGYRSYHIIAEVPVYFSEQKSFIRVEIQIRTIAMDFWASLDHELKYKKEIPDAEEISEELRACADIIADTDEKMLAIRRRLEQKSAAG